MRSKLLLLLMLVSVVGCPINLDTELYPTEQPASNDLVGVYRPTAETEELITTEGGYAKREISITLMADGRFRIKNIPDWWRDSFGKPGGGFDNGSGTWKTVKSQRWWDLELSGYHSVNLFGQSAPYDIAIYVGDPDNGRSMRFRRDLSATVRP